MKMFNISDVNDDDNGWSMMEHRVMSYCNLSWHQVINILEPHYMCSVDYAVVTLCQTQRKFI